MTERRWWCEWPLAVFTLCLQVACGLALAATWLGVQHIATSVRIVPAVFPVICLGLIASMLHLGRPHAGWRALTNLRQSRLSREILLAGLFAFSALIYGFAPTHSLEQLLGVITSVLGISAVVASAAIYKVPARPDWDFRSIVAAFLGSTSLVAGMAVGHVMPQRLGSVAVVLGAALLVLSGAQMWVRTLSSDERWVRRLLAAYLLLCALLPFVGGLNLPLTAAAILITLLLGRMLMYALAEQRPQF